jgi:CDP-diacylglycerol---glycerol-3-phosphate 3-phosphatidyltransferase
MASPGLILSYYDKLNSLIYVLNKDAFMDRPTAAPSVAPWVRKLPNQLTWLRMLCIPIVVYFMLLGNEYHDGVTFEFQWSDLAAGALFALAAITDFFDGYLARKYQVETVLGKLLDPVADKLLVVSALIILVEKHRMAGWVAVILIARDLGINAIRLQAMEDKVFIASSWLGKTKTVLLDISIVGFCVMHNFYGFSFHFWGNVFLWLAVIASVGSAVQYLWGYGKGLKAI